MTERLLKTTSSTTPLPQLTPAQVRRREVRERARRELPELRRRSEEAIATLHRLAGRACVR
jgi:hypothetical protein